GLFRNPASRRNRVPESPALPFSPFVGGDCTSFSPLLNSTPLPSSPFAGGGVLGGLTPPRSPPSPFLDGGALGELMPPRSPSSPFAGGTGRLASLAALSAALALAASSRRIATR